jgi:hypothetical protein
MRGSANSRHRQIDSAAKALFLAGLREGLCREDSAAAAGFSLTGFYGARRRDPGFAADWAAALALPPAAERRTLAYEQRGEVRITGANRRLLQRRRRRNVRFTAVRREAYLTHFIATGDRVAAAAAAGVSPATVDYHRRKDPVFAEACRQAWSESVVRLETEAVRLALAAQARLRQIVESAADAPHRPLLADEGAEFDRIMRLLDYRDRKPNRPASNFKPGSKHAPWSFERAIRALDKALDSFGIERIPFPKESEGDGEPEPEDDDRPTRPDPKTAKPRPGTGKSRHPGESRDP